MKVQFLRGERAVYHLQMVTYRIRTTAARRVGEIRTFKYMAQKCVRVQAVIKADMTGIY